jgi:hypothetical protein
MGAAVLSEVSEFACRSTLRTGSWRLVGEDTFSPLPPPSSHVRVSTSQSSNECDYWGTLCWGSSSSSSSSSTSFPSSTCPSPFSTSPFPSPSVLLFSSFSFFFYIFSFFYLSFSFFYFSSSSSFFF